MTDSFIQNIQDGYPGLSRFMGPNFDQGLGIFKRFGDLNCRNLLYMQAELLCLDEELRVLTLVDHNGPDSTRATYARNVWNMRKDAKSLQWAKILELRWKLNAYNNALLQQAQIAKLDTANQYDLNSLLHWLEDKNGGNGFLYGVEAGAWNENDLADLITIASRASNDGFMRWLEEKIIPRLPPFALRLWKQPIRGSEGVGVARCNLSLLNALGRIVTVFLAATVPSVAVLALYLIKSLEYRLCAVAAFSTCFAIVLAVFTTSRSVEIFTATAAFASVQVVFLELNILGDTLSGYIRKSTLETFLRGKYPQVQDFGIAGELRLIRSAEHGEAKQLASQYVAWVPEPQKANNFLLDVHLENEYGVTTPLQAQVDTGANSLFIDHAKADQLGLEIQRHGNDLDVVAANNTRIDIVGQIHPVWYPGSTGQRLCDPFFVVQNLPYDVIIGRSRWNEVLPHLSPEVLASVLRRPPNYATPSAKLSLPPTSYSDTLRGRPRSYAIDYGPSHSRTTTNQSRDHHSYAARTYSDVSSSSEDTESNSTPWGTWTWSAAHSNYYRSRLCGNGHIEYEWAVAQG
ncbi:hypothetical protein K458DRAFT_400068 [Lentithecium fluviatile CBS 122367]|uniref:DUF6594 domain-containing protein n=1 Tax=Lentithecium fluviatile CBS 122367 TaxID=1168545 RepID=A0A6G1JFN1_9PLEO|nr:hypothetical protein K458DRAFT_400068 [Lentithecium fluviatile CBS 122367]